MNFQVPLSVVVVFEFIGVRSSIKFEFRQVYRNTVTESLISIVGETHLFFMDCESYVIFLI